MAGKRLETTRNPQIAKAPTYIGGLDDILYGGLPVGRTTMVSGGPGCGKSIMGMQFIFNGAQHGQPGMFISFEEPVTAIRQNAATIGIDFPAAEAAGNVFLYAPPINRKINKSGDFDLGGLMAIIEGQSKAMNARRLVLDGIDVLLRYYDDVAREREELYFLNDWLRAKNLTTILTVKLPPNETSVERYDFLDYMTDCVIHLDQRVIDQITTRRLRINKYRGSGHGRNEYPFIVSRNGLNLVPVSSITLKHQKMGAFISSGNDQLDEVLGGGYRRGSCVLVSGTTGSGKTTVAATFADAACRRGERVLYIDFEESEEAMIETMRSPGIDLQPHLEAEQLMFLTTMPEARGAEEHLVEAYTAIETFQPRHVVVDAISACSRMGGEQVAFEYVVRLIYACKERSITCLLTNQTAGFQNVSEISGIGISSVVDTLLFLRLVNSTGEINRLLTVVKSRGTKHSNQYREFLITDTGFELKNVYSGEGGVLTGVARRVQETRDELDLRRTEMEIRYKEQALERHRTMLDSDHDRLQADVEAMKLELERLKLEYHIAAQARELRRQMRGGDKNDNDNSAFFNDLMRGEDDAR